MKAIKNFWNNEAGFVVTVELILVATILVIGLVSGLTILRDAVLAELGDTAGAFGTIDQSYAVAGAKYDALASSASMGFGDQPDSNDAVSQLGVNLAAVADGLSVVANGTVADASVSALETR